VKVAPMVIELRKEKHAAGSQTMVEALRCITNLGFSHGEGEKMEVGDCFVSADAWRNRCGGYGV